MSRSIHHAVRMKENYENNSDRSNEVYVAQLILWCLFGGIVRHIGLEYGWKYYFI